MDHMAWWRLYLLLIYATNLPQALHFKWSIGHQQLSSISLNSGLSFLPRTRWCHFSLVLTQCHTSSYVWASPSFSSPMGSAGSKSVPGEWCLFMQQWGQNQNRSVNLHLQKCTCTILHVYYEQFHVHFINLYILGAAEMLAMEMKASGMYVSRGLSFRQAEV